MRNWRESNMEDFSDLIPEEKHRILICCIMGLTTAHNGTGFPNPLHEMGYEIVILEWDTVLNSQGEEVSPDLVLVDGLSNHALIVECKSNKLKKDQIDRYNNVEKEDVVDWGISSAEPRKLNHDVTLVTSYENGGRILATLSQWECTFPTLEVGLIAIEKIAHDFNREELNELFPVDIRLSQAPQYLYPVGRGSPDHIIMEHVLQSLLYQLFSTECEKFKISLEEIIIDIFPYWKEMGTYTKEKMRAHIHRVLDTVSNHKRMGRYIGYHNKKITFKVPNYKNTRSIQAFRKLGVDYIQKLKKDYKQKVIEEYLD